MEWLLLRPWITAFKALYAENANPTTSLLALEGVKCLAGSNPIIVNTLLDPYARTAVQYRAFLSDFCFGSVGIALHHKLWDTLDRSFNLPHSETHTTILSRISTYNAPSIPKIMKRRPEVLSESNRDAIHGLNVLLRKLDVKRGLADFGFKGDDIDKAADFAVKSSYYNPWKIERGAIRELIGRAYVGKDVRADF
ncbi:hypothetical protein EAE99_005765 [Botrytis elliptica]|nr:hypothetical protein EAE99_005765 [Botrytis elliptica]